MAVIVRAVPFDRGVRTAGGGKIVASDSLAEDVEDVEGGGAGAGRPVEANAAVEWIGMRGEPGGGRQTGRGCLAFIDCGGQTPDVEAGICDVEEVLVSGDGQWTGLQVGLGHAWKRIHDGAGGQ